MRRGAREEPFHLSVYTDQDPADPQDGEFWLYSSGITRAMWSGCTMLQYWDLKLKDNLLIGNLTDTHAAEGVVPNRLWATVLMPGGTEMVWPYPFAKGASLSGSISNKEVKLRIEGGSTDFTRLFKIDLTARRVE